MDLLQPKYPQPGPEMTSTELDTVTVSYGTLFPAFRDVWNDRYDGKTYQVWVPYSVDTFSITVKKKYAPEVIRGRISTWIWSDGDRSIKNFTLPATPVDTGMNTFEFEVTSATSARSLNPMVNRFRIQVYRDQPGVMPQVPKIVSLSSDCGDLITPVNPESTTYTFTTILSTVQPKFYIKFNESNVSGTLKYNQGNTDKQSTDLWYQGCIRTTYPYKPGSGYGFATYTYSLHLDYLNGYKSRDYKIIVRQAEGLGLKSLSADKHAKIIPELSQSTANYDIYVPFGTTSCSVTPTAFDSTTNIHVAGQWVKSGTASGAILFGIGDSILPITTQKPNNLFFIGKYQIVKHIASQVASRNNMLKSLVLLKKEGSLWSSKSLPTVSADSETFTDTVPFTVSYIKIAATVQEWFASLNNMTINGTATRTGMLADSILLRTGLNVISFNVCSFDSAAIAIKTINIVQLPPPDNDPSSANLKAVSIVHLNYWSWKRIVSGNTGGYVVDAVGSDSSIQPASLDKDFNQDSLTYLSFQNYGISDWSTRSWEQKVDSMVLCVVPAAADTGAAITVAADTSKGYLIPGHSKSLKAQGDTFTTRMYPCKELESRSIIITVTSRDKKNQKVYTVVMKQAPDEMNYKWLKKIYTIKDKIRTVVNGWVTYIDDPQKMQPSFKPLILDYYDTVPFSKACINTGFEQALQYNYLHGVNGVAWHERNTWPRVDVNGNPHDGPGTDNVCSLRPGDNTITIRSYSPNSTKEQVFDNYQDYYLHVYRQQPQTEAKLINVNMMDLAYKPAFHPDTLDYSLTVGYNTKTIQASSTPSTWVQKVTPFDYGKFDLATGPNTIRITTTAEDGKTSRVYTFNITRNYQQSTDPAVKSITVWNGGTGKADRTSLTFTPAFSSNDTLYRLTVPYSLSTVAFTYEPKAPFTSLTSPWLVGCGQGLQDGENVIKFTNVAENGSSKTYTFVVNRLPNADARLANLIASPGTLSPVFTSENTIYTIILPANRSQIAFFPTASDNKATVSINNTIIPNGSASPQLPVAYGNNRFDIQVAAVNGETKTYRIDVSRGGAPNLSGLSISSGILTPSFSPDSTHYTATVTSGIGSISCIPAVTDSSLVIRVNGMLQPSGTASMPIQLQSGTNQITVQVTGKADSTIKKTYSITVNRALSQNADLLSLSLSAGALSPSFTSSETGYTAAVEFGVSSVTVTPALTDANSIIKVNGAAVVSGTASSPVALAVGSNTISVTVTAQDTSVKKVYSIIVNRLLSQNENLSSLSLSSGTLSPLFTSSTTGYTAAVEYDVTSVTVVPVLSDMTGSIKVNGTAVISGNASSPIALTVGLNTINVEATAQDTLIKKIYTVSITRHQSSNTNLKSLSISSGSLFPVFSGATTDYVTSVMNTVSKIIVTPVPEDTTASVKVQGTAVTSGVAPDPIDLDIGENAINIVVTAQNGTVRTYTVLVTRIGANNANLSALVLSNTTLSPSFSSATTTYTATVSNATASLTVTPLLSNTEAKMLVNGTVQQSGTTSSPIPLNVGVNTLTIAVTAEDKTTTKTYTVTITRLASSNANLSGLTISEGVLSPDFTGSTTSYSAIVRNTVSSLTITPVTADMTASVTVNGSAAISGNASEPLSLNEGSNQIDIVVTAQDGTKQNYSLVVTRMSSNDYLADLAISAGTLSPAFNKDTETYSIPVDNTISSVTVTPTLPAVGSSVTVNGTPTVSGIASAAIPLATGENTITVTVTAQDTSFKKSYVLTVTRALSTNANLSSVVLSNGTLSPSFTSGTTSYAATVTNTTASLTVTPVFSNAFSTMTVNGTVQSSATASSPLQLAVGQNTITIEVTAQDGITKKSYTFTVTRLASSNADLSGLAVSQGTLSPLFASGTTTYSDTVSSAVSSLRITPAVSDLTASVTVNGTATATGSPSEQINLNEGANLIDVVVTAQDGTQKTYSLSVTRLMSNNDLSGLSPSAGTISPAFDKDGLTYSVQVDNATTSITLTPALPAVGSRVTVNGVATTSGTASAAIPLATGTNTITVIVAAQDTSLKKIYMLTVTRALSTNANLSGLVVSDGVLSPVFSSGTITYLDSVNNSVTSVTVTPTLADTTASVRVNGTLVTPGQASGSINLNQGDNTVTIKVTAQNSSIEKTYTVIVNRKEISTNANLGSFTLSDGWSYPGFAPNIFSYTGAVHKATGSISVTPVTAHSGATVKINNVSVNSGTASGSIALTNGDNTITITVTAEDGTTTKTYTVSMHREEVTVLTARNARNAQNAGEHSVDLKWPSSGAGYTYKVYSATGTLFSTAPEISTVAAMEANGTLYGTTSTTMMTVTQTVDLFDSWYYNVLAVDTLNNKTAMVKVLGLHGSQTSNSHNWDVWSNANALHNSGISGVDATSVGSTVFTTPGHSWSGKSNPVISQCITSPSISDFVYIPGGFTSFSSNYTIMLWVKTTSTSAGWLLAKQEKDGISGDGSLYGIKLYMNGNGTVLWETGSTTSGQKNSVVSSHSVNDGAWHQIALVVDVSTMKLTIDNNAAATTAITYPRLNTSMSAVAIGGNPASTAESLPSLSGTGLFSGSIDDVTIYYGYALDDASVQQRYTDQSH